jgi:type VI secretion system protein ImpG
MIERYYEEELRYLYESGKEFARTYPAQAQRMNIDAVGDRDPYVERLFEGFAFLAARIRQKLDDAFPELTAGVLDLLWPHFLHEIPAVSILQFTPRSGMLHETRVLPRGSETVSAAVGAEATICRFTTTQAVRVSPMSLSGIERAVDTRGKASLSFRFSIDSGANWQKLALDRIRLYLHAEPAVALMLYQFLTARVTAAAVSLGTGGAVVTLDPGTVCRPAGLDEDESLLPFTQPDFGGFMLLREYFVHPEKFLFVDLCGAEKLPALDPAPTSLAFTLQFDGDFPVSKPFARDAFRLHCAPAVNLFQRDAEPFEREGSSCRVVADATHPTSVLVHSIAAVNGTDRITGERSVYEPAHTFDNLRAAPSKRLYTVRYERGYRGQREVVVEFSPSPSAGAGQPREESLTIGAWCHNGILPAEELKEGGISRPGRNFPDFIGISNLTRPTLPCAPPENADRHWLFLGQLCSSQSLLGSAEALKGFLRLHAWSGNEARNRLLEAIDRVQIDPTETMAGGSAVRGVRVTLSMAAGQALDACELQLFGTVLQEFLRQFATVNTPIELQIDHQPAGQPIRWRSQAGKRCLI